MRVDETLVDEHIHIALTFDDDWWAPAYATMRSICIATHRRSDLVFHLCHLPLTDEHRADLEKIGAEFGSQVLFYDLSRHEAFQSLSGRVPRHARWPDLVYARFVLESLLPDDVRRVIYLDSDMMVMAPIEQLWDQNMGGLPAAAVPDPWGKLIGNGRDFRQRSDLHPADPYFNAGLMMIDLDVWRREHVGARLESLVADGTVARLVTSQNVINYLLKNRWQPLDTLWNVVDPVAAHVPLNPNNLHFTGSKRPWALTARMRGVGYARIYRHVMTNELFYRFWRYRLKKRLAHYLPFLKIN